MTCKDVDLREDASYTQIQVFKFQIKSSIFNQIYFNSFNHLFCGQFLHSISFWQVGKNLSIFLFTRFTSFFPQKDFVTFSILVILSNFQLLRFLSLRMILVIYFYSFSLNATLHQIRYKHLCPNLLSPNIQTTRNPLWTPNLLCSIMNSVRIVWLTKSKISWPNIRTALQHQMNSSRRIEIILNCWELSRVQKQI